MCNCKFKIMKEMIKVQNAKQFIMVDSEEIKRIIELLEDLSKKINGNYGVDLSNKWLNNEQVKKMLGVSIRTLQHYRDTCVLKFVQHGRKIYYHIDDIQKYMDDHRIKF